MAEAPSLGTQIKNARKLANMTQSDVADKLSISVQAVSQWETNKTIPTFRNLQDLKKVIGLTVDEGLSASSLLLHRHEPFLDSESSVRAPIVPWEKPEQWHNTELDFDNLNQWYPDDFLEVKWKPRGEVYALIVPNDILKPDFTRGDHIIIDTGRAPEKDDVVVAEVNGLVTWGRYRLMGTDAHRAPIFELHHNYMDRGIRHPRVDTSIPGRVIGVVREQRRYYRTD